MAVRPTISETKTLVDDLVTALNYLYENHLVGDRYTQTLRLGDLSELQVQLDNEPPGLFLNTGKLQTIQDALESLVGEFVVRWCVREDHQAYTKLPGREARGLGLAPTMNHTPDFNEAYSILLQDAGRDAEVSTPQVGVLNNAEWYNHAVAVLDEIKKQRWFTQIDNDSNGEIYTELSFTTSDATDVLARDWFWRFSTEDVGFWRNGPVKVNSSGSYTIFLHGANDPSIGVSLYSVSDTQTNTYITSIDGCPGGLAKGIFGLTTGRFALDHKDLTSVSADLYTNCSEVEGISFENSGLDSIPSGLFDDCIKINGFYRCFYYTKISTIPTGLFDSCSEVTSFNDCFHGTKISTIPTGLFDYCPEVTSFTECFRNTEIDSIPSGLFDSNIHSKADEFARCFFTCKKLGENKATLPAFWDDFTDSSVWTDDCFAETYYEGEKDVDDDDELETYYYYPTNWNDVPDAWGGGDPLTPNNL